MPNPRLQRGRQTPVEDFQDCDSFPEVNHYYNHTLYKLQKIVRGGFYFTDGLINLGPLR